VTVRRSAAVAFAVLLCGLSCARDPEALARRYAENGDRHAREGRHAAAVIEYRNAVRLAPAWSDTYWRLGDALASLGRSDAADQAYITASRLVHGPSLPRDESSLRVLVESHPRFTAARLALAERLIERGARAEAEVQLEAGLALEPSHELANRALAALHLADGRLPEAEARLRTAAAVEPQRYRSQLALADFLIAQRRWDDARATLAPATGDARIDDRALLRLAVIADARGARDEARSALAKVLASRPTAEAWALQAQFALEDDKPAEALDAARQALALDPTLEAANALVDAVRRQQPRGHRPQ
jgi:tetratricopeptide (TPR) repeat protein